jgi:hypothetical protein
VREAMGLTEREELFDLMRRYCRIACLFPREGDTEWLDDADQLQDVKLVLAEAAKTEAAIWALLARVRNHPRPTTTRPIPRS